MKDTDYRAIISAAAEANGIKLDPDFLTGDGTFSGSDDCAELATDVYGGMMLIFRSKNQKSALNPLDKWKKNLVEYSQIIASLDAPGSVASLASLRAKYEGIRSNYPELEADESFVSKILPFVRQTLDGANMVSSRKNCPIAHVLGPAMETLRKLYEDIDGRVIDTTSASARNYAQTIVNALHEWRDACQAGMLTEPQSQKLLEQACKAAKSWSENRKFLTLAPATAKLELPDPDTDAFTRLLESPEAAGALKQFLDLLEARNEELKNFDTLSVDLKEAQARITELEEKQASLYADYQNGIISVEDFAEQAEELDQEIGLEQITIDGITPTIENLKASNRAMRAMISEFNILKIYYKQYESKPAILAHIFAGVPYTAFKDVLDGIASPETERQARIYIQAIPERANDIVSKTTQGATKMRERAQAGRQTTATFSLGNAQQARQDRKTAAEQYAAKFAAQRAGKTPTATVPVAGTPIANTPVSNDTHKLEDDI